MSRSEKEIMLISLAKTMKKEPAKLSSTQPPTTKRSTDTRKVNTSHLQSRFSSEFGVNNASVQNTHRESTNESARRSHDSKRGKKKDEKRTTEDTRAKLELFRKQASKQIGEQISTINTLASLNNSRETQLILNQLGVRKSIVNMGDAHVQKKNEQRLMNLATFDTQDRLPTQIWYDQLRADDDGSFSKIAAIKPDKHIDYLTQMPSRESQFRHRILTDRMADLNTKILSPQALSSNEITFGPLKKLKSPISSLAKELD